MSNSRQQLVLTLAMSVLAAAAWAPVALAQQGGTVAGRVTDARSGQPIAGAAIQIEGTALGTAADDNGRYRIGNVPAGRQTINARRIGYAAGRQTVTVPAGAPATADFALQPAALSLDAVVVTGTAGGEQLRSIGNSVTTIQAQEALTLSAAPNLGTLLNARSPGVTIFTNSGRVGAGPAITIRGRSSIGLGNSPLIYIDGVRVDNSVGVGPNSAGGFSGQNSQVGGRLNDITPEDIERIEIIKGPAAATIYGTEASNGVIQIITKRGSSGPRPQAAIQLQQGLSWFRDAEGRFPTNYAACTAAQVVPTSNTPLCHNQAVGTILTWNAVRDGRVFGDDRLFQTGGTSLVGGSVTGGINDVRYYVSSTYERDKGIEPNNSLQQASAHANLDVTIHPTLNLATSINYVDLRARLGVESGASVFFAGMYGHEILNPTSRGFASGFIPEVTQQYWDNLSNTNRLTASGRLEHIPSTWFRHRLQLGVDYAGDDSRNLERFVPPALATTISPVVASGRILQTLRRGVGLTMDYAGTASSVVRGPLSQAASVGVQVFRRQEDLSQLGGIGFPGAGIETVSGTATPLASVQQERLNTTVGAYFQEKLNWGDRLFLTGAVRVDNNSAFGEDFKWVTYPKVDASWVVSEEGFWPWERLVPTVRLRAAYGESGRQPETFVALQTFTPVQGPGGTNAVTPGSIGNPDLRPERGKEVEVGFEAGFLDRFTLDFTYFNKRTTDLIINQAVSPSSGFSGTRPVNLGRVDNSGIELSATAQVLRRADLQWDINASVATNGDEIKSLGGVPSLVANIGQFNVVGRPIQAWYARRVVSADRDPVTNRATNVLCEGGPGNAPVACATAPFVFIGTPTPKVTGAVANTLTLFQRLRLYALVDFKRGHRKFNADELIRCSGLLGVGMCEANFYPERYSPMYLAYAVGTALPSGTIAEYIQDASFAKLREVSASYTVPERLVWGASGATITIAARELRTWTDYRSLDPENNVGNSSLFTSQDQAITPPLTRLIATLNLRF